MASISAIPEALMATNDLGICVCTVGYLGRARGGRKVTPNLFG